MSESQNTVVTEWMGQQILDATKLGYCILNLEFEFQSVDDRVTQITGFDKAYLTSHSLKDLVPVAILTNYEKSFKTILSDTKHHIEIPIQSQDGESVWVVLTCVSLDDSQIHLLMQDVTDIHQQGEQRTATIFSSLSDSVMIVNRDKEIVQIYPNDTINLVPVEFVGNSLRDGMIAQDLADEISYYIDRTLDTGTVQAFEFHSFVDENETRYYNIRIAPIDKEEVLTLVREITDLKRVQEELSSHIEDLTILRQVDAELADKLKIERATQLGLDAMMRLSNARSGFVALIEAEQLKLIHIIGSYNVPQLTQYLEREGTLVAEVLKTRQPVWLINDEFKKHPSYVPLIEKSVGVIIIPLKLQNRMIGIVNLETTIAEDFTYETYEFLQLMVGRIAVSLENARLVAQINWQLEEQQRLYEEVSRLEQIKTDMIRIASHDLRNPLAAILGYLEMLNWDMEKVDKVHQGYLGNIEEAARRMQKITSDILSLERIEESALQNNTDVFDLISVLQQTYNEHRSSAQLKQQKYDLELPDKQVVVDADQVQLHEAIANLVGNAIKYTPENGDIKLKLDVVEKTARVRVVDNGYGIPDDKQERLFQPFYRAKMQETESIQGTGLGLHLVKNIVERFEGTLVFKSTHKVGSTFGFDIPLSEKTLSSSTDTSDGIDGSVVVG
jgi:PAS domain S-box-containing protein